MCSTLAEAKTATFDVGLDSACFERRRKAELEIGLHKFGKLARQEGSWESRSVSQLAGLIEVMHCLFDHSERSSSWKAAVEH